MEQTGGKGIIGPSGSALDMQQIAYYIKQFGSRGADASVAGSYAATVKKSFEAGGGDYDLFVKQIKEATVYLPQYNQELKQAIAQLPEAQAQQEKAQAELEAAKTTLGTDELAKPVVDFGKALDELSRKIHELSQSSTAPQTSMDTKEIGVTDEEANKANKNLNNITKTVTKQDNAVSKLIKNYFGYRAALRLLQRITKTSTQAIIQFDKALTEQAMVSGQTREQTYKLLNTYQELAKLLGATTTEVASVATEYFRQGKSANEALKLTEAAVSAAKVASISTSESVNYLTTAINGFRLSADDAITVSDKFAALAASSATSYQELAIALSKVASQANLAGMSMDYTLGLLATGIEATRESAESIGTALKTVIARMRELTDYGKTLDDNETLNNVEKQLQYVGVALRNAQGELRSTEEVLDEIGQAWNTYSSNQQAAIAKALAGTRQQSRLISILDNYDRTLELVSISEQSAGATAAQLSVYMEGLGAATNSLSTAWMQLTSSFVNSDWLISTINKLSIFISYLGQCQDLLPKIIIFLLAMGAANLANSIATASAAAAEGKRQAGLVGSVVALISNTKATNANTAAKVANTSATLGLIGAGIGVTAVIGLGITAIVK